MCGIAGQVSLNNQPITSINHSLDVMSSLISHRGPDGNDKWISKSRKVGFSHRRLAIIDLSQSASQPMQAQNNNVITYNGEIYNYRELRSALKQYWNFRTQSDTECILAAYDKNRDDCLDYLRGMFSFALWDEKRQRLFCARGSIWYQAFLLCCDRWYLLFFL